MNPPNWPELIKALTLRGWNQAQLAERIGVKQSTISAIATGDTKDPRHSLGRVLEAIVASGEQPKATQ